MNNEELQRKRELAVALKRYHSVTLRECFDPQDPESRPTEKQLQILREMVDVLFQYVMGGNQSGKSQTGGRVVSWFYQRTHPYLNVDELWPDDPMVILVVGRVHTQVEELWERKIKPFLQPDEYKENRQGGTLQWVTNPKNGSKIIFASHGNPVEARERVQSYSCHLVWLDELCDYLGMIEELQRRVQAKRGRMLVTFTPKIRAEEVRRFIETPTPYSKIYRISMLDNPVYDGRRDEIMSQILQLPKAQQDTILYGEWYVGELAVYNFIPDQHVENPPNYSVLWPHIVSVDPAASGLMGFTLWAAPHENAHRWWCVRAEYIKGGAPSDLIELVESKVKGHNILFRCSDPHESWFVKQAAKLKIHYRVVEHKRDRKKELIAGLNQALANGRVRLAGPAQELIGELGSAQWSETAVDKIVNASSYHLADSAQYFVDLMPKFKTDQVSTHSADYALHLANKQRIANELKRAQPGRKKGQWRIMSRGGQTWRRQKPA